MARKPAAAKQPHQRPKGYALRLIEAADAQEPIVERIANGQSYRAIAKEIGTSAGWLCHWIDADPERSHAAARAREQSAQMFDEMALESIDDASDPFALAKAREKAVHYRWKAKAANPRRYGEKVDITGEVGIKAIPDDQLKAEVLKLVGKLGLLADVPSPK